MSNSSGNFQSQATKIADWGLATELAALLEEITDLRSQYGRPSVDEPILLKRCRQLAGLLEASLRSAAAPEAS